MSFALGARARRLLPSYVLGGVVLSRLLVGCSGDDSHDSVSDAASTSPGDGTATDGSVTPDDATVTPLPDADGVMPNNNGRGPAADDGSPSGAETGPATEAGPMHNGDAGAQPDGNAAAMTDGDAGTRPDGDAAAMTDGDVGTEPDGDAAAMTDGDAGTEPDGDAEPVIEAGTGNPTEALIQDQKGASCVTCARENNCLSPAQTCDGLSSATDGGDAGSSVRACLDTLACLLVTGCYEQGSAVDQCICGPQSVEDCTAHGPLLDAGEVCTREELAGLRVSDVRAALDAETDATSPAGVANNLALCIFNAECVDCF